uniref:Chromo domain-containing protein n=1 Tax=Ditylenchus dipsaci TaxID=166011 RepID=A0A915CY25_9BILA
MDEEELVLVLEPDGNSNPQSANQSSSDVVSSAEADQVDVPSVLAIEKANKQETENSEDNKSPISLALQTESCEESINQSKSSESEAEAANETDELILQLDTTKEEQEEPGIQEQQQSAKSQEEEEEVESGRGKDKNKGPSNKSATPDRISPLSTSSTSGLYSDGSSSTVEVFEVEAIMGHKVVKGKTFFKVRWQNFGPKDDTWEPEENLAANPILTKSIENYWEHKKADKQKKGDVKKESPKQPKVVPDEGSKEIRRLFVADRVPTETEKKLAEIKPGVRVLRNHLRNQTTDDSVKSESPMPETKPARRSKAASGAGARKSAAAVATSAATPSGLDEDKSTEDVKDHAPARVERRGRPRKKPKEEPVTTSSEEKKAHTSKQPLVPKPEEQVDQATNDAPLPEPKLKQESLPVVKASRKRARKTDSYSQERKEEEEEEAKQSESASGTSHQPKPKVSSFVGSARPASSTARPPATLTKVKLEAMKRPIQRTSEEQISNSRKSAKPPMDDKWTAKQKRIYSLDLPVGITKVKDVGEWIGQQVITKLESIQLTQEEFEEAVMEGKVDRVRAALRTEKGRLDVNEVDASGRTLLHKVCEIKCGMTHTQCELIDILVANGARMDAKDTTNGQIPLHVAIANRRLCHVRKLLALRSPVNTSDYSDQPPIVTAFNCSDAEFIVALLNAGATFQPAFRAKPATNKHLLKRVLSHQTRLQTSFDKARQTITSNMTVNPVSPIFVNPLYEAREIEHSFRVDDATLPGPHCAYMVFTCLCDFSTDRLDSRMWSSSPVVRISINNRDCRLLQEKSKFVFLAALRNGFNMLNIELNASQCDSSDLKLLTQVCMVQLQKTGNGQHTRPIAPVQPTMQHNLAAGVEECDHLEKIRVKKLRICRANF